MRRQSAALIKERHALVLSREKISTDEVSKKYVSMINNIKTKFKKEELQKGRRSGIPDDSIKCLKQVGSTAAQQIQGFLLMAHLTAHNNSFPVHPTLPFFKLLLLKKRLCEVLLFLNPALVQVDTLGNIPFSLTEPISHFAAFSANAAPLSKLGNFRLPFRFQLAETGSTGVH